MSIPCPFHGCSDRADVVMLSSKMGQCQPRSTRVDAVGRLWALATRCKATALLLSSETKTRKRSGTPSPSGATASAWTTAPFVRWSVRDLMQHMHA